jgi:hypothetical protein
MSLALKAAPALVALAGAGFAGGYAIRGATDGDGPAKASSNAAVATPAGSATEIPALSGAPSVPALKVKRRKRGGGTQVASGPPAADTPPSTGTAPPSTGSTPPTTGGAPQPTQQNNTPQQPQHQPEQPLDSGE